MEEEKHDSQNEVQCFLFLVAANEKEKKKKLSACDHEE